MFGYNKSCHRTPNRALRARLLAPVRLNVRVQIMQFGASFEFSFGTRPARRKTMSIALAVVSIIFAIISLTYYFNSKNYVDNGILIKGVVDDLLKGTKVIVAYRDDQGRKKYYISEYSQNPPSHRIGEEVILLQLPGIKDKYRIDSFSELWLMTLIMAIVSSIFMIFSIVIWKYGKQIYAMVGYPELSD